MAARPPPPPFRPDLKVGDHWYIKPSGKSALDEYEILDVTKSTVEIKECGVSHPPVRRYSIFDVKFIEKVKK
jgi:hypothetical protein